MNLSGMSVLELVRKYEVDPEKDLIVIYDELDLPLGMIRVRARGSSAGHNGMQSTINALQTEEIARIGLGLRRTILVKVEPSTFWRRFSKSQLWQWTKRWMLRRRL